MNVREKLRSPSIFIGKQGGDVISFGAGQPDLLPPSQAVEGVSVRKDFRYGLIQGDISLREALSAEYPGSTADNFVITNGASEALDLIFRTMENGKVLIPRPYYYSYPVILKYTGMEPVYTQLKNGRINLDDFQKKAGECKAVLINSPSNPTGRVESTETLKEIEKITAQKGIYLVSDEVYKDIIYDRENYPVKGEHVITVNSFSKTYALCGVRVGYLWSLDQKLINKIVGVKTHTSINTNLVGQDMALKAMEATKTYVAEQLAIWRRRRDIIYSGLLDMGLDLWKPEGAFYVLPRVKNNYDFVWKLYTEYKVITYPGDWFGAPGRIRLSYALDENEILEGLDRMKMCLKEFK